MKLNMMELNICLFFFKLMKNKMKFGKFKNIMKKEFDSEPSYNEKYLKAKINSYNGKINENFHNDKIPTEGY